MCYAIPGKVVEMDGENVIVDYGEEKRKAKNLIDIKVGDWVIVNSKVVIKKVPEKEALGAIRLIKNIESYSKSSIGD